MVIKLVLKVNVIEVNELSKTEQGGGGFGSTGTK
jgi:dUTPase